MSEPLNPHSLAFNSMPGVRCLPHVGRRARVSCSKDAAREHSSMHYNYAYARMKNLFEFANSAKLSGLALVPAVIVLPGASMGLNSSPCKPGFASLLIFYYELVLVLSINK